MDWRGHVSCRITEEMKKFVDEEIFGDKEFTFIDTKNSLARCSKCEQEYKIDFPVKHNSTIVCPNCGALTKMKYTRYRYKHLQNRACMYYFDKSLGDPKALVCRGYLITRNYEDYKNPITTYDLQAIYIFGDKVSKMWKHCYWGKGFEERASIFSFNNSSYFSKFYEYVDWASLLKALEGSYIQYANVLDWKEKEIVKVLDRYTKYPWIEQLYKAGYRKIAEEVIDGRTHARTLNFKGKNIYEILKINKGELKKAGVKGKCFDTHYVKLCQEKIKQNSNIDYEKISKIVRDCGWTGHIDDFIKVSRYSNIEKACKYIYKQMEGKDYLKSFTDVLITYRDYIMSVKILNINIKDRHVLFPKNIFVAHDNANKRIKLKRDKELDVKIQKRASKLDGYKYSNANYLIRPIISAKEMIDEGEKLHHCVATHYMEPYAEGKTIILCVRAIGEEDKQLVTVEVKGRVIRQAYGIHDTTPPEDVLSFLEEYKANVLKKNKKIA